MKNKAKELMENKPTKWNDEAKDKAVDIILKKYSNGESIRTILGSGRDKISLPSRDVFYKWLFNDRDLQAKYTIANHLKCDLMAEQMLEISDQANEDTYIDEHGKVKTNHNAINRDRLKVDTRKWYLSKILPKKYGDRVSHDITTGIKQNELTDEELDAELVKAKLILKDGQEKGS